MNCINPKNDDTEKTIDNTFKCPHCNNISQERTKYCSICGKKTFNTKRRMLGVYIAIAVILISLLTTLLVISNHSKDIYEQAETLASMGKYTQAIEYYERVIPTLFNNFPLLDERINFSKEELRRETIAAKAIVALINTNALFDVNKIEKVYIINNSNSAAFEIDTVFVKTKVKSYDCMYCITTKEVEELKDAVSTPFGIPLYTDTKYGMSIYGFGENTHKFSAIAKGFQIDLMNDFFSDFVRISNELNKDNVMDVVNTYNKTGDETLLG